MDLTKPNIDFVYYGLDQSFRGAYADQPTFWKQFAMEIPSGTRENHYAWTGRLPKMREWVGERQLRNYASRAYVLPNKDFEETLQLDRNDILDDQFGIYSQFAKDLGVQCALLQDDQVTSVLESGTTNLCFDGQPFFNNAHPVDVDNPSGTTYQNNYDNTSNGGNASMPLTPANYQTVRTNMWSIKSEDQRSLAIMGDLLIVPPKLEATGKQILESTYVAPTGAVGSNAASVMQESITKGTAKLLVDPYLTSDTAWYLACTSRPMKPLIWQQRQAPQMVYKNNVTDDNVFMLKKFIFGVDARGAAGYGMPFLISRASA